MKKILLTLLLLNLIHFNIYGETHTIALSYDISPTYTVTIPKQVDITEPHTEFNFSVSGDIYKDYCLEIIFDTNVTISDGIDSVNVSVSQDKTTFSYEEIINKPQASISINHQELCAGNYTGQLNLSISLKEGA